MNIHTPDPLGNLPLFTWAQERATRCRQPVNYAARILGRRNRLSTVRAALVASLAGFYVEECF